MSGAVCADCAAPLTPGARFCHRCGTPAGTSTGAARAADRGVAGALPWAVAGIALLALIALVAAQSFSRKPSSTLDAPQNALPQAGLDDRGAQQPQADGGVRAPDITNLSPKERADRLFERVVRLDEQGKTDSVRFFAPMAIGAYQQLDSLGADERFHLGMIALATKFNEVNGVAKSEADTILARDRNDLLGLILAKRAAAARNDQGTASEMQRRLKSAATAELAKPRVDYQQHRVLIDAELKGATERE